MQTYNTPTARIGKFKGKILARAHPVEVLGITGQQRQMPRNKSNTISFRRWLPYGNVDNKWISAATTDAAATFVSDHVLTEGVTPTADTITATDVEVVLVQYGCLYGVTDKTVDLYEDDIPQEMIAQVGERLGMLHEMIRYGALKACTNKFYAGGTSRATVDETLSRNLLRNVLRSLDAYHAMSITRILAPSANFGTSSVQAAFLVFCHTDMASDIRDLPKFIDVADYGSRQPVHEMEIGSMERFRFICSPELVPIQDAGATASGTGLLTSGTKVDVYPVVVAGQNAWGQLALRGSKSIDPTYLPPKGKDKADPLGQKGFIGASTYAAAAVTNDDWMAILEAGVSSL